MARKARTDSGKTEAQGVGDSDVSKVTPEGMAQDRTGEPVTLSEPPKAGPPEIGGPAPEVPPAVDPFEQPAVAPKAAPPPPVKAPRRPIWPMLMAGVVTVGLGLAAGIYLMRAGGPLADTRLPALETRVGELEARLAAAEGLAGAALTGDALLPLSGRIDALEKGLAKGFADAAAARDALSQAIDEVRQRPAEADPAAVAAYERELAAMRAMLDSELARIREAAAQAAEAKSDATLAGDAAARRAALAAIGAALDSGAAFPAELDGLAALSPELDLAPLRAFAEGVEPLAALQRDFPDAARTAIDAAAQAGSEGGIGGFLKGQLGLRSLAPREGDSPDAVLSRAEARLQAADLAGALAEADALTGPAADALQPWRERAERRLAALAAFAALDGKVGN